MLRRPVATLRFLLERMQHVNRPLQPRRVDVATRRADAAIGAAIVVLHDVDEAAAPAEPLPRLRIRRAASLLRHEQRVSDVPLYRIGIAREVLLTAGAELYSLQPCLHEVQLVSIILQYLYIVVLSWSRFGTN